MQADALQDIADQLGGLPHRAELSVELTLGKAWPADDCGQQRRVLHPSTTWVGIYLVLKGCKQLAQSAQSLRSPSHRLSSGPVRCTWAHSRDAALEIHQHVFLPKKFVEQKEQSQLGNKADLKGDPSSSAQRWLTR